MCGIAVILRLGARPLPDDGVMARMLAAIAHRGPDGQGSVRLDDTAMLGAVRLAVIDPGGGKQPVTGCPSARVACVYNGELYDAPDHRRALAAAGHALADHCDTTLLPHLYEEHGEAMVERMRGMFAFALWDGARRRLLLARDRMGIKPLVWARTADYLVAASEAKALFASGLVDPAIDPDALDDLFSLSYPCPPRTMFRGVKELRPAHRLVVEGGHVGEPRRWWRAPFRPAAEHPRRSEKDCARELREVLAGAVKSHLVADVPVGARVSGGLDSSAIAALAREAGGDLTTFTIGFDDPRFDERAHAREVARHLGARGHEVLASAAAAARLPAMIEALEMPQPVPVAIGGLLLAEQERASGVPVVVTGEGADELLGGYDVFRASRTKRAMSGPFGGAARSLAFRAMEKLTHLPAGVGRFLADNASLDPALQRSFFGVRPPWYDIWRMLDVERDALLSPGGARRVRPIEEPPEGFRALVRDDVAALDPFDAELALELETRLPSWILVIGDRTAMAHGVEMRVPFLDHRVVELIAAMPPAVKAGGLGGEKDVLRDAVADLLPRSIVRRRKQPFLTPVSEWFFSAGAPAFVGESLSPGAIADAGLFDPDAVVRLRRGLAEAPPGSLIRIRHELVTMLVLGTQLLHGRFVARRAT